jgi:deoxynucleoside triphosphate triphosphohydrolase SAMHD1
MTPQWFAEDFLRVYTKKPQFFGLVQAGYRAVLASMPDEVDLDRLETLVVPSTLDLDSMAPTPPATEAPSTPKAKAHTRDNSFTFPSASGPSKTPFLNNSFTTVPPTFTPGSPTQNSKKRRNASAKRLHDDSQSSLSQHDGPSKKKQKQ